MILTAGIPEVSCNPEMWQRHLPPLVSLRTQPAAPYVWHFSQRWGPGGLSLTRCLCSPPSSASSHTIEGPPRHTYESLLWSMCANSAHLLPSSAPCFSVLLEPWEGRRVVLGPCFRVTLECICVLVYLNLLPARCLCASPWFQARVVPHPQSLETPEAAWPGLSSHLGPAGSAGAPRRSCAAALLRAEGRTMGTARDGAGLGVASLPQPQNTSSRPERGN